MANETPETTVTEDENYITAEISRSMSADNTSSIFGGGKPAEKTQDADDVDDELDDDSDDEESTDDDSDSEPDKSSRAWSKAHQKKDQQRAEELRRAKAENDLLKEQIQLLRDNQDRKPATKDEKPTQDDAESQVDSMLEELEEMDDMDDTGVMRKKLVKVLKAMRTLRAPDKSLVDRLEELQGKVNDYEKFKAESIDRTQRIIEEAELKSLDTEFGAQYRNDALDLAIERLEELGFNDSAKPTQKLFFKTLREAYQELSGKPGKKKPNAPATKPDAGVGGRPVEEKARPMNLRDAKAELFRKMQK